MALSNKASRALLTGFLVMGTFMQMLDTTIANVALPHMQGSLNASQDQISWVITSYIVASAISLSLTTFLADRFGRKRMLVLAIVGFTATSALCTMAQTLEQIVMFRALQGFSSAWIMPLSQSTILDAYPADRQAHAMTIWGIGGTLGPTLGPTLGGFFTEHFNWRWVFMINVPIGIVTAIALILLLRESERKRETHFDGLGFGFLACALAAVQLMLDRGQTQDWFGSTEIVVEAIVAAIGFYLFVVHVLTTPRPFINLKLYRNWNYSVGLVMVFIAAALPMTTMVLMPLLLQNVMGYPVDTVGLLMAPRGGGTLCMMFLVAPLVRLIGTRATAIAGLAIMTVALTSMCRFTVDTSETTLFFTALIQGFGMGLLFVPLNLLLLGTVDRTMLTEAAAMGNLFRSLGSSVGISILVTLLSQNTQTVRAGLTEYITPFSQSLQNMAGPVISNPQQALVMINGEIDRQAAMTAFVDDFRLLTLLTCAIFPLLFLLRSSQRVAIGEPAAAVEA